MSLTVLTCATHAHCVAGVVWSRNDIRSKHGCNTSDKGEFTCTWVSGETTEQEVLIP